MSIDRRRSPWRNEHIEEEKGTERGGEREREERRERKRKREKEEERERERERERKRKRERELSESDVEKGLKREKARVRRLSARKVVRGFCCWGGGQGARCAGYVPLH